MADIVKLIYKGDEMAQGGGSGGISNLTVTSISQQSDRIRQNSPVTMTYTIPHAGFISVYIPKRYSEEIGGEAVRISTSASTSAVFEMSDQSYEYPNPEAGTEIYPTKTYAVGPGTFSITGRIHENATDITDGGYIRLEEYAYFS